MTISKKQQVIYHQILRKLIKSTNVIKLSITIICHIKVQQQNTYNTTHLLVKRRIFKNFCLSGYLKPQLDVLKYQCKQPDQMLSNLLIYTKTIVFLYIANQISRLSYSQSVNRIDLHLPYSTELQRHKTLPVHKQSIMFYLPTNFSSFAIQNSFSINVLYNGNILLAAIWPNFLLPLQYGTTTHQLFEYRHSSVISLTNVINQT